MPIAIGALYVRRYFTSTEKKEAERMVRNIRKQLRKVLQGVEWMDKLTMGRALDKLNAMEAHVGYPDELLNDTLLEQFYDRVKLLLKSFVRMLLNVLYETEFYNIPQFVHLRYFS